MAPRGRAAVAGIGPAHAGRCALYAGRAARLGTRALADDADSSQATVALALAVLSALFNGSWPVCNRILPTPPDPVVFNAIASLGVFLSSLPVPWLAGKAYEFTLGGALGGALFVFAALFSFIAIPRCGLATAQAVWSVSAILVASAWGIFGPAEVAAPVADLTLTLAAVTLLVVGALLAVSCETVAQRLWPSEEAAPADAGKAGESKEAEASGGRAAGLAAALAVGFFGGSVLVPLKFVPAEVAGLAAVPSFGFGALVAGFAVTAAYWSGVKKETGLPQIPVNVLGAGVVGGLVWNLGNVCSIVAQSPPFSLAYGVAYPIRECALFFGGLWGIFVFQEIRGAAVGVFGLGAAALASGIVALSIYGPGAG